MNKFSIAIGLLVYANAVSAAPVIDMSSPAPTERVTVADLNLFGNAGKATLQARIRSAAGRVCGSHGSTLAENTGASRCIRTAIAGALAQVDRTVAARSSKIVDTAKLAVTSGR
jgi:UrcA family protein